MVNGAVERVGGLLPGLTPRKDRDRDFISRQKKIYFDVE
jgi:hypothetical protein